MQFLIDITALTFSSHYITAVVNIHKVLSFYQSKAVTVARALIFQIFDLG